SVVPKVASALQKVYADKQPDISWEWPEQARIPLEEGDTFEMIGNLLDNACKHGNGKVQLTVFIEQSQFRLVVENDGQDIPAEERSRMMQRGVRRDEQSPGQGIGLAVVADIVAAYGGTLAIATSPLGGALFEVRLPR